MSTANGAYRLGLHYTDVWSIDIADIVEPLEPIGVKPPPLTVEQTVTLGKWDKDDPFDLNGMYWGFPYFPTDSTKPDVTFESLQAKMPIGTLDAGTRILVRIEPQIGAISFHSLLPLLSLEYKGKVYHRDDHPAGNTGYGFFDTTIDEPYPAIVVSVPFSDVGNPFYEFCHWGGVANQLMPPGTQVTLKATLY